jgi:hypothetical protein
VNVTNDIGTDADIPAWDGVADKAAMYMGEVTQSAPTDGATVTEPLGYVWLEYGEDGPPPPVASDRTEHLLYYFDFSYPFVDYAGSSQYLREVAGQFGYGLGNGAQLNVPSFQMDSDFDTGVFGGNCLGWSLGSSQFYKVAVTRHVGGIAFSPSTLGQAWSSDDNSIAILFYPNTLASKQTILSCSAWQNNNGPHITINTDGTVEWGGGDGLAPFDGHDLETVTSVTNVVTAAQWNLIVVTHDSATKTIGISVNGGPLETGNYTKALSTASAQLIMGSRIYTSGGVSDQPVVADSKLQSVIVFNEPLSQATISDLYNGGSFLNVNEFFFVTDGNNSPMPAGGSELGIGTGGDIAVIHVDAADAWGPNQNASQALLTDEACDTDAQNVRSWHGSFGSHYTFQNTGSSYPEYKTNIQNGLPVVRFDGTECLGSSSGSWWPRHTIGSSLTELTVFFAGSATSTGTIVTVRNGSTNLGPRILAMSDGRLQFNDATNPTTDANVGDAVGAGVFFVGAVKYDNGTVKIWINGSLSVTDSSNPELSYTLDAFPAPQMGSDLFDSVTATSRTLTGDIGEVISYAEALTDDDIVAVQGWLNNKWAAY